MLSGETLVGINLKIYDSTRTQAIRLQTDRVKILSNCSSNTKKYIKLKGTGKELLVNFHKQQLDVTLKFKQDSV